MELNTIKEIISEWYIYVVLILFWSLAFAIVPFFRNVSAFSSILLAAVPIALVGLGQTVVVLTADFDLSVGAVASLATAIASVTMGWNIGVSIALVLVVALGIGVVNGLGITKLGITSFIMTLGMMFFINGVALFIRPSPGGIIPKIFKNIMLYHVVGLPLTAILIIVSASVIAVFFLQRREFGRHVYAVGGDPEIAKLLGVNVDWTRIKVFAISAVCAAIAGLFIAARIGSGNATAGGPYLFDSFVVVFMGGTLISGGAGGYKGTIGAALIIASLSHILNLMGVLIWYHYIVRGILLAGVVAAQQMVAGE